MMGSTASGKSTALRNNPKLKELAYSTGLVYDGAFISIPSFESRLKMVQDRGFKASIVFVHNDPVTGFTNMINRLIRSNRAMSRYYYVYCYPLFKGRIAYLQKEHPDITLYCLDNSHNKGGVRVSIDRSLSTQASSPPPRCKPSSQNNYSQRNTAPLRRAGSAPA